MLNSAHQNPGPHSVGIPGAVRFDDVFEFAKQLLVRHHLTTNSLNAEEVIKVADSGVTLPSYVEQALCEADYYASSLLAHAKAETAMRELSAIYTMIYGRGAESADYDDWTAEELKRYVGSDEAAVVLVAAIRVVALDNQCSRNLNAAYTAIEGHL